MSVDTGWRWAYKSGITLSAVPSAETLTGVVRLTTFFIRRDAMNAHRPRSPFQLRKEARHLPLAFGERRAPGGLFGEMG